MRKPAFCTAKTKIQILNLNDSTFIKSLIKDEYKFQLCFTSYINLILTSSSLINLFFPGCSCFILPQTRIICILQLLLV